MKPDVIVSWPKNCDYPLWRQFIRDNRDRFDKVIISFTQTFLGENYMAFVQQAMAEDQCIFLDTAPTDGRDWRDVAVNDALEISTAEWVWFTEQDFIIKTGFWQEIDAIFEKNKKTQIIGVMDGDRLHPCCIFASRNAINQTRKMFGIIVNELDHFGVFQRDIEEKEFLTATINPATYNHLAGVSHNFRLVFENMEPVYRPKEFKEYLAQCILVKVPLDPRFVEVASRVLNVPTQSPATTPPPKPSLKKQK
jgi:hypothetical protein